jgi:hypothetical protein
MEYVVAAANVRPPLPSMDAGFITKETSDVSFVKRPPAPPPDATL